MTRQGFQNLVEGFLIEARAYYCMAEVAQANSYPDHILHWRNDVERILFAELPFFTGYAKAKPPFDKRKAIDEIVARYRGVDFQSSLLLARRALAARYLRQLRGDLKLPDVEVSKNAFWLTVAEAINLALEV